MNFEEDWKSSKDFLIKKIMNDDFSLEKNKPYIFVKVNYYGWFKYYCNPFTGETKLALDENDILFLGDTNEN